jgi:urease accessory protein
MNLSLTRLLQLTSPALPVGAYTYSQGLEWAIEAGTVQDEASALRWVSAQMQLNLACYELPLVHRMLTAHRYSKVSAGDTAISSRDSTMNGLDTLHTLDAEYLASRESAELRAETVQMGYSMRRLLGELPDFPQALRSYLSSFDEPSFPLVWSAAAAHWGINDSDALTGWLWSWCENQVMAALKAVPLGQAAGQRLLCALGEQIPEIVSRALTHDLDMDSNFAPGFALACARHETQYSRLFRS